MGLVWPLMFFSEAFFFVASIEPTFRLHRTNVVSLLLIIQHLCYKNSRYSSLQFVPGASTSGCSSTGTAVVGSLQYQSVPYVRCMIFIFLFIKYQVLSYWCTGTCWCIYWLHMLVLDNREVRKHSACCVPVNA